MTTTWTDNLAKLCAGFSRWEPEPAELDEWADQLASRNQDIVCEAIRDVIGTYSSRTPSVAWVTKRVTVIERDRRDAERDRRAPNDEDARAPSLIRADAFAELARRKLVEFESAGEDVGAQCGYRVGVQISEWSDVDVTIGYRRLVGVGVLPVPDGWGIRVA